MTKVYFYGIFGLVLAALAGWGWQGHQTGRVLRAEAKVAATQLDTTQRALGASEAAAALLQETLKAHAAELSRQRAAAAQARKALNDALKAAPDWATAPLPDGVRNALRPPAAGASAPAPGKPAG